MRQHGFFSFLWLTCAVHLRLLIFLLPPAFCVVQTVTVSPGNDSTSESGSRWQNSSASPTWHAHTHEDENGTVTFNVTVDAVTLKESQFFIEKLFWKYGDQGGISMENLEAMFRHLGLGNHIGHSGKNSVTRKRAANPKHVHTAHKECLTMAEMLEAFHLATLTSLSQEQFSYLCPALVYQLDLGVCDLHLHHDQVSDSHGDHDHEEDHNKPMAEEAEFDLSRIPAKVWGFSTVAVLIISLVGLLGVAVIPIMQKVFYNHLLQFLVALAIGALSGDALLHLLPHSVMTDSGHKHDHDEEMAEEHNHRQAAWKGLVALGGILFFFVIERLLTIITVIKRNRNSKKQKKKKRCEKFCDIENNKKSVASKLSHKQDNEDECDRTIMLVHPNKALKSYADTAHDELMHQCDEDVNGVAAGKRMSGGDPELELLEVSKDGDKDAGFGHSHGGHGHGHAHSVPNSVAAVAWMVILGDGIHNFSDGLAIGAAFANSITGGFSTSVAVFCHELPHEIGDFAVLLRAGMTVKQAIMYNCLSSLLCFMGMLIGVSIGNISSASLWIFAAVGGMFLYIALVDMLPEMSSVDPKKGENPFLHLLLQVMGILLGSGIMLVIALYEHDLKQSLG